MRVVTWAIQPQERSRVSSHPSQKRGSRPMRNEQDFVYELLHQGLLKGDSMDAATASHRLDQVNLPGDLLAKVDATHGLQWGRFDPPIGVATLRFQRTNS